MATTLRSTNRSSQDKSAEALSEEAAKDMETIRADIAALRGDLAGLIETVASIAKVKSLDGLESGKEMASEAGEKLDEARGKLEAEVRAKPLTAIGIALAVGALFASLRRG